MAQASRLGMAQTMVQPRGSGEIFAPARLENAQYSRCNATRYSNSAQYKWRTLHSETLISTKTHASNEKTTDHNASAKLEEALGKLQQMFADNAEAEASCKSVEKERRNVEQTEHQEAQVAQQAILQDIHTS